MDVKLDQKLVFLIFHLIVMLETRGGRDKKLQDYLGVTKPFFNPDTSTTVRVIFSGMKNLDFTTCIQIRHAYRMIFVTVSHGPGQTQNACQSVTK